MNGEVWLVELELKRIQTYLFQVPRLRAMIGANALIGETLRGLWTGSGFADEPRSLPFLATKCAAAWPNVSVNADLRHDPSDPLRATIAATDQVIPQDDVLTVATKTGVLTRDGGHFEAVFPSEQTAKDFVQQAARLVGERLPGVLIEGRIAELCCEAGQYRKRQRTFPGMTVKRQDALDLPFAEPCQWSGQEPASQRLIESNEDRPFVGKSVAARHARGKAFDEGQTRDILGLLRSTMRAAVDAHANEPFPSDFSKLASGGYLGVVHIDGNSVGRRYEVHKNQLQNDPGNGDFFQHWAHRERFFYPLRCGMRKAVLAAIRDTFHSLRNRQGYIPLRVLMLGGDDLVLVCGAPYALPFVVKLAKQIGEATSSLTTEQGMPGPLTLGAGVAIVQASFPFHRAHQLAEQLASSAKRLKASLPADAHPSEGNVVDWIVTTEAWHGDIRQTRQRIAILDEQVVLSGKPYRILTPREDRSLGACSLEALLEDAKHLAGLTQERKIARSQMQRLARSLHDGRHTARFVAETLPFRVREALRNVGGSKRAYLRQDSGPWLSDRAPFVTQFQDLLELFELELLRNQDAPRESTRRKPHEEEPTHA